MVLPCHALPCHVLSATPTVLSATPTAMADLAALFAMAALAAMATLATLAALAAAALAAATLAAATLARLVSDIRPAVVSARMMHMVTSPPAATARSLFRALPGRNPVSRAGGRTRASSEPIFSAVHAFLPICVRLPSSCVLLASS